MVHHHREGRVFSVDRVRSELLAGPRTEDLVRWVMGYEVPEGFFVPVDIDGVVRVYTDIMMWVQRHPKYLDLAKAKFATGADGWLVAYARVHGATVVTNEQSAPESRREIARCMRSVRGPAREHFRHASGAERLLRLGGRRLSDPRMAPGRARKRLQPPSSTAAPASSWAKGAAKLNATGHRTGGRWTRRGRPTRSTRYANASTAPQRKRRQGRRSAALRASRSGRRVGVARLDPSHRATGHRSAGRRPSPAAASDTGAGRSRSSSRLLRRMRRPSSISDRARGSCWNHRCTVVRWRPGRGEALSRAASSRRSSTPAYGQAVPKPAGGCPARATSRIGG